MVEIERQKYGKDKMRMKSEIFKNVYDNKMFGIMSFYFWNPKTYIKKKLALRCLFRRLELVPDTRKFLFHE